MVSGVNLFMVLNLLCDLMTIWKLIITILNTTSKTVIASEVYSFDCILLGKLSEGAVNDYFTAGFSFNLEILDSNIQKYIRK